MRSLPTSAHESKPVLVPHPVPSDLDSETIHDVPLPRRAPVELDAATWRTLFRIRDSVARRFFLKFRERIPLAEFQSEGNEVLAEIVLSWETWHRDTSVSIATITYRRLRQRLHDVPRQEWGQHGKRHGPRRFNDRTYVAVHETDRIDTDASLETACDIHRVCTYIQTHYSSTLAWNFLSALRGESTREHTNATGRKKDTVWRERVRLTREVHAWCVQQA